VAVDTYVLVELEAQRQQLCLEYQGFWHGVLFSDGNLSAQTYCGRAAYIDRNIRASQGVFWDRRLPDCPKCAVFKTAWVCLRVLPYQDKRVVAKKIDKETVEKARRGRFPTAFDRILAEDFIEAPTYKPEPVRPPTPEPDPFSVYELDERERKLSAARDRNQRLKSAKKEMKGH
jgi:hypothetical protein